MTVSYIAGSTASANDISAPFTLDIANPAGIAVGDLLVAFIDNGVNTTAPTTPAGWTLRDSATTSASWIGCYTKIVASGDIGATPSWVMPATGKYAGIIEAYRGAQGLGDIDHATAATSGTTINSPDLTLNAGEILLECAFARGTDPGVWTAPSELTLRHGVNQSATGAVALATGDDFSSPSTAGAWTGGATTTQRAVIAVALVPTQVTATVVSADTTTGWTVTGAGGNATTALSDTDDATFLTSPSNPTNALLAVTMAVIDQPAAGANLYVDVKADQLGGSSGSIYAELLQGTTLRATTAPVALGVGSGSSVTGTVTLTFLAADLAGVTSWTSGLKLKIYATAA